MKRNVWKNNVKRILALTIMACTLFTWHKAGGDVKIMPCGNGFEEVILQL